MQRRFLVVEDEKDLAGMLQHAPERSIRVTVNIVDSGNVAMKAMPHDRPDQSFSISAQVSVRCTF